ncbi:MAG: DUF962 domain-containing protein [Proteobacteria bacterium]|nr:DUF962 domain-containing protein [Pseudomonadota bacterium]
MDRSGYTQEWVDRYNASHQHPLNRALHAVGIPMIAIAVPLGLASLAIAGLRLPALGLFVSGWVLQFIGHWVEGKPPAFLSDWRFLVTGLTWWVKKLRGGSRR